MELSVVAIRKQDPWYRDPFEAIRVSTWTEAPRGELTHYEHPVVGDNELTKERSLPVSVVAGAEEGPVLLLIAGEHGNEYESIVALQEVIRDLDPADLKGTVVGVNCCSVDSYLNHIREGKADGQNLARVYPGKVDGTLTERVAYTLQNDFLGQPAPHKPALMVPLHTYGPSLLGTSLAGYSIYPGEPELTERQRRAAKQTGIPLVWGHEFDATHAASAEMGHEASGRTALYAGFLAEVPAIYFETAWGMGGENEYVRGLRRLLVHLGMVVGKNEPLEPRRLVESTAHQAWLMGAHNQTPTAGLWRPERKIWEHVAEGDVLGTIYDLHGKPVHELLARQDGIVISTARAQYMEAHTHCGLVL